MASGETVQRPLLRVLPWTLWVAALMTILAFSELCHGQNTTAAVPSDPCTSLQCIHGNCSAVDGTANCTCENGWMGTACAQDKDECAGTPSPCADTNSECRNNNGSYTCICKTGYEKFNNSANCTDKDECADNTTCPNTNSQCHNTVGSFECLCKDGYEKVTGATNCTDKNECEAGTSHCPDSNAHCMNTEGSFNCTCNRGYERLTDVANCTDKNECLLNPSPCPENSQCNNNVGSYNCTCKEGYALTQDKKCADVNECLDSSVCVPNGVYCENTAGSFSCHCKTGWTGPKCSIDVDECVNTTRCIDQHSKCKNTNGSYNCPCKTGYERVTDTADCTEKVLLHYDNNTSRRFTGDDDIFGPFYVPEGFVIWGVPHVSYFVSVNGYITFDTKLDKKFAPDVNSPALKDRTIIAPYWSDIEIPANSTTTGLYHVELSLRDTLMNNTLQPVFKEYTDWIVQKVNVTNFDPVYIAVWTWENVLPYKADNFRDILAATFQVVLTTNGLQSFAIIGYRTVWPMDAHVTVGGFLQSVSQEGTVNQETLHPVDSVPKWKVHHFQNDMNLSTNADCIRWVYQLNKTAVPSGVPCPCSAIQAKADILFSMNAIANCATSKIWNSEGVKTVCCYHNQSNMLIKRFQDVQAPFHPLMFKDVNITAKQQDGFQACCGGNSSLCYEFYDVFPLGQCAAYTAPMSALLWGDPHLASLDGREFSFNGLGEYVILQSSNASLEVQGRTKQLAGQNVTVFAAFAIREGAGPRVEVRHAGANKVAVLINGQPEKFTGGPVQENFTYVESVDTGKAALIIFTTGVSIKISAMNESLSLNLLVKPGQLSQAKGLLGYVDGKKENDFTFRNGTELTGLPVAQDIFQFGQSWLIPFQNQSFFTYDGNDTFAMYQHPDFMPTFLPTTMDAVLIALNKTGKMEVGQALCGSSLACLQDFLVTGNNETALETNTTQNEVKNMLSVLASKPPEFNSPQEIWNVSLSNGTFIYPVSVKADAGGLFPNVTVQATGLNYTFDAVPADTGAWKFTWVLNKSSALGAPVQITFTATNAAGLKTEYTPIVILCACSQDSQCYQPSLPNSIQQYAIRAGPLYCQCEPDKGGRFCKEVVPVCDACFTNATCNHNATDGKYCQACPQGYTGDGIKCFEVNECLMRGECEQHCQNTIGNFTCSCDSGYRLEGRTACKEIDECAEKTDNCNATQFCHNTPGSFYCVCQPGTGGPSCQTKVSHVYVGQVVFLDLVQYQQGWVNDLTLPSSSAFKTLAGRVQNEVTTALKKGSVTPIDVTVIAFAHFPPSSQRRRRSAETSQPMIQATFQVDLDAVKNASDLNTALAYGFNSKCIGDLCTFNGLEGVSRSGSKFDENYDLCASDRHNNCHNPSTNCTSADGTFSCTCLPGFQRWDLLDNACEDIDECMMYNTTYNCGVANGSAVCHNTMGSYKCDCPITHYWNGARCELFKCEVEPYPCQNGAVCVNLAENASFACRCAYGWTGSLCDQEDSEAKKMKATVIGLAAGLGAFCVVLIIIIIVICALRGRQKDRQSTYNGNYQIPRPHLKTGDGSEMSRQDSMHKYTDFRRSTTLEDEDAEGANGGKPGMQHYVNPVFTREEDKL